MATSTSPADREAAVSRLLSNGPRTANELASALEVSGPTFSRTIHGMVGEVVQFRQAGIRAPMYAAVRPLRALPGTQSVYRVDRNGSVAEVARVHLLMGGATLTQRTSGRARLYDGLPPEMAFAAPSGFLGRQVAEAVSDRLGLPKSIKDWQPDHAFTYLFNLGWDTPGDLVFGNGALEELLRSWTQTPVPAGDRLPHYLRRARTEIDQPVGSSAGGEQPKFTAELEDVGHVIVKFARAGTRMADILVLEELTLNALAETGLPAAKAAALLHGDLVFLESQRFDRVGHQGRIGVISAGAVDDEEFGRRDSWSQFAQRCLAARLLTAEQARTIHVFAAFSELIGHGDTHFENLSLMTEEGHPSGVAPAYDMAPMRYAALGTGLDPALEPIQPSVRTVGARPDVWAPARSAATHFWQRAASDTRLSEGMRSLARTNQDVVERFTAPLIEGSRAG
jgi:hypothetical protein